MQEGQRRQKRNTWGKRLRRNALFIRIVLVQFQFSLFKIIGSHEGGNCLANEWIMNDGAGDGFVELSMFEAHEPSANFQRLPQERTRLLGE
jgi:hypothetical protein